jgi:hypothetical protein
MQCPISCAITVVKKPELLFWNFLLNLTSGKGLPPLGNPEEPVHQNFWIFDAS